MQQLIASLVQQPPIATTTLPTIVIAVAVIGFLSQPVATVINSMLQSRNAKASAKREEAVRLAAEQVKATAAQAQAANELAQSKQQEDAAIAQKQAADAVTALISAANKVATGQKATVELLADIQATGQGSHDMLNSQRTTWLHMIAELRKVIALQNPDNEQAQLQWHAAEKEATEAEAAQQAGTGAISKEHPNA